MVEHLVISDWERKGIQLCCALGQQYCVTQLAHFWGQTNCSPPPKKKKQTNDQPRLPESPTSSSSSSSSDLETWARLGERNSISGSPMQILPSQLGVPTVSRPLSRHGNSSPVMEARAAWPQNGTSHAAKRRLMTTVHCSLIWISVIIAEYSCLVTHLLWKGQL